MEGRTFGRYRLLDVVGRGGMGEVWRAFDTATERTVAIKVLSPHLVSDGEYRQRFQREAKSAAALSEPHVVPIYDFGEIDGHMYVAMQLVNGHNLQALLTHGPLQPARAVSIIEQIAAALNAAHRTGLIHRDVKPSNILITEDDFAYLIDFGIARAAGETALTNTGATIGTMEYMAPERFDTGTADARSDIYALTCVLYQALTGRPPFNATGLQQLIHAQLFTPPPRPSESNPHLPPALDRVIETGMAKDPGYRYTTTRELAQAARAALSAPSHQPGPTAAAYPTVGARELPHAHPTPAPKPHRRRLIALIAAACAITLAGIAGIVLTVRTPSGEHRASSAPADSVTRAPSAAKKPLTELLLSPAELSSILRVPGIENTGSVRTTLDHTGDNVQPPNCLALAAVAQDRVYERGRHTGLRTSDFTDGKPAGVSRWGTQAVVSFPNVENATAFYKESAKEWERCGRAFTTQWGTPDQNRDERTVWLINDARRILSTKFTALYVHCGRALAMRHNVVGDVIVCRRPTSDDLSTDDEALAVDVAQQISDKMS